MKRVLLYLSLITYHLSLAQNLVPNYSFEDTIKCVQHDDQFTYYVANWLGQGGAGGLCYFTSNCSGFGYDVGVPSNILGFQYARTGVAYAGIYTYISDTAYNNPSDTVTNFRNYIEVKLTSSLVSTTKYFVTFYVSAANTNNFACNDIGAYLSDSALVFDTIARSKVKEYLTPQIANNPISNSLTDTLHWVKVTGSYKANGGEQYIIIGNFKNDTISHIQYLGHKTAIGYGAYYYIDDVFVTTDSLLAGASEVKEKEEAVKLFPNPANTMLNISVQLEQGAIEHFCLYNNIGQLIQCIELGKSLTTLPITNLPVGVYYYRITDNKGALLKADKETIIH